jgi:hypothetical protein
MRGIDDCERPTGQWAQRDIRDRQELKLLFATRAVSFGSWPSSPPSFSASAALVHSEGFRVMQLDSHDPGIDIKRRNY